MTDYLISETFHSTVGNLALITIGLGFVIVGGAMVIRKPLELRLFGAALLIFVFCQILVVFLGGALDTVTLGNLSLPFFMDALLLLLALVFVYLVAVNDFSARQRRIAHGVFAVYVLGYLAFSVGLSIDIGAFINEASVELENITVAQYNPLLLLYVGLGLAFIAYQAIHVIVEHSRGQIYRSLLLGSFGVLAGIGTVQYILRGHITNVEEFLFWFAAGVVATVFWVTVLIHDIPEIRRGRAEST